MNYLLDTCVISELIKKQPSQKVIGWINACDEERFYLSVLTLGEIQKGISKLPKSKKKSLLEEWLHNDLIQRFEGRILNISEVVALAWGNIQAAAEQKGKPIPSIDSLIAATAIVNDMVVVSRDIKGLKNCGVRVLNPWENLE